MLWITIPANIVPTNKNTSPENVSILIKAEPGKNPAVPQSAPNRKAPMISLLSSSVRDGHSNLIPTTGGFFLQQGHLRHSHAKHTIHYKGQQPVKTEACHIKNCQRFRFCPQFPRSLALIKIPKTQSNFIAFTTFNYSAFQMLIIA